MRDVLMAERIKIGLALSGGGSWAIAFHLGCLRALHDRGVLPKVSVLSAVSGGSVIAALYAYSDDSFAEFETQVLRLLRRGLVWGIARQTLLSLETPKILLAICSAGVCAAIGAAVRAVILLLGLFKIDGSDRKSTSELQSLMRISYAVFCLKQKKTKQQRR